MLDPTHVLIVDDAPGVCWSVARTLRRHGYKCTTASDGPAALSMLQSQPCDVVLADIRMPGNEHLELVREAQRVAPEIPVILMTGHPSLELALRAIDHSVAGFLVKPFDVSDLVARISHAVHHRRTGVPAAIGAGPVEAPAAPAPEGEAHLVSFLVTAFLEHHLLRASKETIASYGTALDLLVRFCVERTGTPPSALTIEQIDPELVVEFIVSLSTERGYSLATCAARISALRSFFRYAAASAPAAARLVRATRLAGAAPRDSQPDELLTAAELDAIVSAPDRATAMGRRDFAVLLLLTRTELNAADLLALDARDLHLGPGGAALSLRRRGRVATVRLPRLVARALREVQEDRKTATWPEDALFVSARGQRLSRDVLRDILRRAVSTASADRPWLTAARATIPILRRSAKAASAGGSRPAS